MLIPAEPRQRRRRSEPSTEVIVELQRIVHSAGGRVLLHPDAFLEIANDRDDGRRLTRTTLARKYAVLESPPELSLKLGTLFGSPPQNYAYVEPEVLERLGPPSASVTPISGQSASVQCVDCTLLVTNRSGSR